VEKEKRDKTSGMIASIISARHCDRSVAIPKIQRGPAYRGLPRRSSSQ